MGVQIFPSYEDLSRSAAQFIADAIRQKPDLILGLAAGNTPLGVYRELVRMHRDGSLDFSRVAVFNLDEYAGLDASDTRSFTSFLRKNFIDLINVSESNVHLLKFPDMSVDVYCEDVEEAIRQAGGIDLQILGIGRNGHIAFNEPGSSFKSRTRVVKVAEPSAPEFATAITMGIATILDARRILLLASGPVKAEILAKAIEGPVTETLPASVLQLHADVTFMVEASSAVHLRGT
jgi:glucosamine-6-phosphate deaminase